MTQFATEFPVRPLPNTASFVAQVVTWLRGARYSTVLDDASEADLDGVAPVVRGHTGEELRLRMLESEGVLKAIGFRHDFPDNDGRLWRTEAVLRRGDGQRSAGLLRLRTECMARVAGATLATPRKPYILKTLLRDGWGAEDRSFVVSDEVHQLDGDAGVETAVAITRGDASLYLPVVYVSAIGPERWSLSEQQIEQLAYDLGGVAHVVAEPDRTFSFLVRDATAGENVYGGTIGLAVPGRGFVRRFYIGGHLVDPADLQAAVRDFACLWRSRLPSEGWDWSELQEQALRQQRTRERNRLSAEESEALYEEEISILKDQIAQLKAQIAASDPVGGTDAEDALIPPSLGPQLGPEIYPGELVDRLRAAAKGLLSRADVDGLDGRSKALLGRFSALEPSPALAELGEDLARATKDPKRLAANLSDVLSRHGYTEKQRNKHVVLEPRPGFEGLDSITVPTTPSDARGLKNALAQVKRTLGLNKLRD
jgi:hypothetical protein